MTFAVENLKVVNEGKAGVPILTGVGFFDHMLDQFNSHAQVGVGLQVAVSDSSIDLNNRNRHSSTNQNLLCEDVGKALGTTMYETLALDSFPENTESRFCCPLDEALVECVIRKANGSSDTNLKEYSLAPYGIYPKGKGRSKIGEWQTESIQDFWQSLAKAAQLEVSFRKIRGDNGHHIAESSFKAFSRAFRNYLDSAASATSIWSPTGANHQASVDLKREAKVERATKETSISVRLQLNGEIDQTMVHTGIPVLDEFFTVLAQEARMTLQIQCTGDLWVDDHHTAEDVSIAVGQCLTQALGTKAGLNRMWIADGQIDGGNKVEVTMDLSNRPYLGHNLHDTLGLAEYIDPETNSGECPLTCEMFEHVLDSLVMNGRMTVHIVESSSTPTDSPPPSVRNTVMATAKAFGAALRVCSMVDQRRAGQTASSKGTLSV